MLRWSGVMRFRIDYDGRGGLKLQTGLSIIATSGKPEGHLSFDLIIPLRLPRYG